jgi:hypothetical protein
MSFKPSDFFIGVTDFFSVLLPGALVTYFLVNPLYPYLFNGKIFPVLTTAPEKWIAFLFAAYIVGNILFGLSSLLDKVVYNKLIRKYFTRNFDLSYKTATAIRNQFIPADDWIMKFKNADLITDHQFETLTANNRREIINTFKWAQYLLECVQPESLQDIRRSEADSKFFRSLVLSLLLIGIYLLFQSNIAISVAAFALSLISLYRYADLRYKSTERAYELVITITHKKRSADTNLAETIDNRSVFKASEEKKKEYENLILQVSAGEQRTTLIDISKRKKWNTGRLREDEWIYCVSGKTIMNDPAKGQLFISNGALVRLKKEVSYQIENQQEESLLLLSIK